MIHSDKHSQQASSELHTSKLLQDFLQQHPEQKIRLGVLLQGLGDRAFGPALLVCALPEALPLPIAGVSAIVGIPLVLVSLQLVLGFREPWLPRWLANRSFRRKDFEKGVHFILRYLKKFERLIRPRWQFATKPSVQRLLGILFLMLAVVIFLPIPLGNMLPAIALVMISLGLIEGDGLLVVIGAIAAFVILAIMAGAIVSVFSWAIGTLGRRLN